MNLRMWTYDLAREQTPSYEHLRRLLETTRAGGYNAFGLYMEHGFAYPEMPWMHGKNAVTPEIIQALEKEFPDIQIVPFVNLLGHFEGMLYTEEGKRYAEQRLKGMQACPSNPEFVRLAEQMIEGMLSVFSSKLIHIGGDETWQLGQCPLCKARVNEYETTPGVDGKALLYGSHFAPLARRVIDAGRRPGVWGDMFLDHPTALDLMPRETLIFDWQYFSSPLGTSKGFIEKGFDVVCSPSIQTYNATWCHLSQSEKNVRDAVAAAKELNAEGVCVTTWECGLFGNYDTLLPAIRAAGKTLTGSADTPVGKAPELIQDSTLPEETAEALRLAYLTRRITIDEVVAVVETPKPAFGTRDHTDSAFLTEYATESGEYAEWAYLMSEELQKVGGVFAHSQTRSSLKCRLLLYANPFLAWLHHQDELSGEAGDRALTILDNAMSVAQTPADRGVTQFAIKAIQFVRQAEKAHVAYAADKPGEAMSALSPCRQIFEDIEKIAIATQLNIGGSMADIHRCRVAREAVERAIRRIKEYGDRSLGYLPAFEVLTHPMFVPGDQACWWLINGWARE